MAEGRPAPSIAAERLVSMSHAMSQVARQVLAQQQRLTPQLIQAMDILQLNAMALESRISQELDSNPALEATLLEDESSPAGPDAEPSGETTARVERDEAMVVKEGDAKDFER